jgi:HlyD family secretion protein
MKRWKRALAVVLVFATIAGAGYLGVHSARGGAAPEIEAPTTVEVTRGDVQTTVTAPGHLVNVHQTTLALAVGGSVAEVNVQPGQQVEAGAVLAQLHLGSLQDQVLAAQAELGVAQARLDQLQAGASPAQVAAAEATLHSAQASLERLLAGPSDSDLEAAKLRVDAARNQLWSAQAQRDAIKGNPLSSPAQIDAAEAQVLLAEVAVEQALLSRRELSQPPSAADLALAESQVAQAQALLEQLTAGPSDAELRQAEAAVQSAEAALNRAQAELQAATLTAPFDGIVVEVSVSAGQIVSPGMGWIRLVDPSALEVEATVIEEDLPLLQVGQQVELFFDAQPDAQLPGWVARIVPERLPGDRPLYPVYIAAGDLPGGLLAGMTADASIIVDSRQDVLRLPRSLVRARSNGVATVRVWIGTEIQERSIRVGLRGDTYVEILEGLHEGEQVVAQ